MISFGKLQRMQSRFHGSKSTEKIIVKGKLSNLGFSYQIEQIVGSVSLARPATWQIQQNSFFLTMCVPVQVLQSSAKLIYSDNITKNSFSIWALKCLSWQTNSFSKCPIKNGLKSTHLKILSHIKRTFVKMWVKNLSIIGIGVPYG